MLCEQNWLEDGGLAKVTNFNWQEFHAFEDLGGDIAFPILNTVVVLPLPLLWLINSIVKADRWTTNYQHSLGSVCLANLPSQLLDWANQVDLIGRKDFFAQAV